MIPTLLYHRATALIISSKVSLLECATAIATHSRWIVSACQRNPPPLLLYVGKATIKAHHPEAVRPESRHAALATPPLRASTSTHECRSLDAACSMKLAAR